MNVTPMAMPAKRSRLVAVVTMEAKHSHCQDKGRCTGPGCRVSTGKTARKR